MVKTTKGKRILNKVSFHPSSYLKLAYLPSSWQLDGLYTLSLILSLDLGTLYAAPLGIVPRASWAHLGRKNGLPRKFQKYCFFHWFFKLFWAPGPPNIRQNGFPKLSGSSQNRLRKMVLHIKAILGCLGLDFGGSWGRLCAS